MILNDCFSYFKYGALGVVIGHELTHGFDDQGILHTCSLYSLSLCLLLGQQYNKDGILTPWWSVASQKEFNQRKQCFVEQYSKYSLFGYNVRPCLKCDSCIGMSYWYRSMAVSLLERT